MLQLVAQSFPSRKKTTIKIHLKGKDREWGFRDGTL
jgi:hypothetical protein